MSAVACTTARVTLAQTQTAINIPQEETIQILVPPPETKNQGVCSDFLAPVIETVIQDPAYKGSSWGILVESLAGETLYHYNANRLFIPASNVKLLTTAAALQKLSPDALIHSKSLQEWITITNLESNNRYADTLLRSIGGSNVVKETLAQLGVDPASYRMADGSGLSRQNAATPGAMVSILRAMYSAPERGVFLASLPVAGMSGTLKNRLKQTPAQGVVYAKTGTLRGVRTLSGYLNHPHYKTLVFSVMVNQPNRSGQSLVKAIDEIVLRLSLLSPCEPESLHRS